MIDSRMKTFLTLCKELNYRKTAAVLHMSQPAVTQQIQSLEREYECKLFIYDKRTLTLTREAELLRGYAENVLYQYNKAKAELKKAPGSAGRSLSIGATKTIGEFVIGKDVARFLSGEGNNLSIEVDNTERLLTQISEGKLDFALVEGFFDRRQFASRLYREEPFVGICEVNHPFAGKEVTFDELWNEHLLLREEGSGTRDILDQTLREHNHSIDEFRRVTTVSNFGLMLQLIESLHGITFAYKAVLGGRDNLSEFRIKGCGVIREFNYVYLNNQFSEEAVDCFEDN